MKRYHVLFFCGTDLRCDVTVNALTELIALACALNDFGLTNWIDHPAMRIEIRADNA